MHDLAAARFCGNNRQLTYDALMRFALMPCRYAAPGCNDAGNASCLKAAAARSPFLETFVTGIMQNVHDAIPQCVQYEEGAIKIILCSGFKPFNLLPILKILP